MAPALPVSASPGFGAGWVGSTLNVVWPTDQLDGVDRLAAHGIGSLRWWGPGCHAHAAYRDCPAEPLPVTRALAAATVGLPFWQDLPAAEIERVCRAAAACCDARTLVAA